ncbi:MAG: cytochrome c biogenesis protein CcdA [Candidatus Dadabacteria bacterium]|nr:cytochrome c biogenesis protein CcdA [Candidatus Dadabacteria bacterium]
MIETASPAFTLAFLAGAASFLSPCIFPLVPGYLSAIAAGNARPVGPAVLFVAGFSSVFSLMGTSASFAGSFLAEYRETLSVVSGALVMILGLFTLEVIKIPFLMRERRASAPGAGRGAAYVFMLGCAFAFGWTPCIGPMLASILSYAALSPEPSGGMLLLLTYSAGLGSPFVLAALFLGRWRSLSALVSRYHSVYKYAVGGMLLVAGFLMAAGLLFYVNIYGQRFFEFLGLDFWTRI